MYYIIVTFLWDICAFSNGFITVIAIASNSLRKWYDDKLVCIGLKQSCMNEILFLGLGLSPYNAWISVL